MIIYKIENNINSKCYIGKTTFDSIWERYHCTKNYEDIIYRHHNKHLRDAFKKYGFENFSFEIICTSDDYEELNYLEVKYIKEYDSFHNGYNCTLGGDGKQTKIFNTYEEFIEYNFKRIFKYRNAVEEDEYYMIKDEIKYSRKYYGENHKYTKYHEKELFEFKERMVDKYLYDSYQCKSFSNPDKTGLQMLF